jgi:hypothetical protein
MAQTESVKFYVRFLTERYQALVASLHELYKVLTQEDREKKAAAAKALHVCVADLKGALSQSDWPAWLRPLDERLHWYLQVWKPQPEAAAGLLDTLMKLHPAITAQSWDFGEASAKYAIDFAAIYQQHFLASKVPQLFDELIAHLETIINSGKIDSLQTISALEKLLATIRKNARGDYFSTRGSWEFTQVFFKNFSLEVIESVPGLTQVSKALRKTMRELDVEMSQVLNHVRKSLTDSIPDPIPMLEYKTLALPKSIETSNSAVPDADKTNAPRVK